MCYVIYVCVMCEFGLVMVLPGEEVPQDFGEMGEAGKLYKFLMIV